MLRTGKSIKIERDHCLLGLGARGGVGQEWGVTADGCGISFLDDFVLWLFVLKLDCGDGYTTL